MRSTNGHRSLAILLGSLLLGGCDFFPYGDWADPDPVVPEYVPCSFADTGAYFERAYWSVSGNAFGAVADVECAGPDCCAEPVVVPIVDQAGMDALYADALEGEEPPTWDPTTESAVALYMQQCPDTSTSFELVGVRYLGPTVDVVVCVWDEELGGDALSRPYLVVGLPAGATDDWSVTVGR